MVHQNYHMTVQLRRERRITLVVGRSCQQNWPENQASTATSRNYRASQFVRLTYKKITMQHILHDRKLHLCNASHTPTATGRQPSVPPRRKNVARSTTQPLPGHSDVTTLQSKLRSYFPHRAPEFHITSLLCRKHIIALVESRSCQLRWP